MRIHPQAIRVHDTAGKQQGIEIVRMGASTVSFTVTLSPQFFSFHPRIVPSVRETIAVFASSVLQGVPRLQQPGLLKAIRRKNGDSFASEGFHGRPDCNIGSIVRIHLSGNII